MIRIAKSITQQTTSVRDLWYKTHQGKFLIFCIYDNLYLCMLVCLFTRTSPQIESTNTLYMQFKSAISTRSWKTYLAQLVTSFECDLPIGGCNWKLELNCIRVRLDFRLGEKYLSIGGTWTESRATIFYIQQSERVKMHFAHFSIGLQIVELHVIRGMSFVLYNV